MARDGEIIESCRILTTDSDGLTKEIHDRIPVILKAGVYNLDGIRIGSKSVG